MKTIIQRLFEIALLIGVGTANAQDEASAEKELRHAEHEFHRGEMKAKMKMHHKQRMDHLSSLDKNDDGKVDLEEYLSNSKERFSNMDINGDGFVTSEEAREARKLMHEKQNAKRQERQKGRFKRNNEESKDDSE